MDNTSSSKTRDRRLSRETVIGFASIIITSIVSYSMLSQEIAVTKRLAANNLFRELTKEFYEEGSAYEQIRVAIDTCKPLYYPNKSANEKLFTYEQINKYLGFMDDIGLFHEQDILDLETITHFFGAAIIEAYTYPEIRRYINEYRSTQDFESVFRSFTDLAQNLEEEIPRMKTFEIQLEKLRQERCGHLYRDQQQ